MAPFLQEDYHIYIDVSKLSPFFLLTIDRVNKLSEEGTTADAITRGIFEFNIFTKERDESPAHVDRILNKSPKMIGLRTAIMEDVKSIHEEGIIDDENS